MTARAGQGAATDEPRSYDIAVIPGDGIGPEVTAEAMKVLEAVAVMSPMEFRFDELPLGADFYLRHGEALPDSMEARIGRADAIFLGAVGDPAVPPGVLERGLILRLRRSFDQYVNYRPAKLYPGVPSVVTTVTPQTCDMVVLRENTEGLYVGSGAYLNRGGPGAVATQNSVSTGYATERIMRHGFDLAETRRRRVAVVHKTNILVHAGQLWLDVLERVRGEHPDVAVDYVHVDAMCQHLLLDPGRFDVIVTENLFGDIISDLTATLQGGLAVAASANLNPARSAPSMFEPVHGSAPDIAGRGWANPAAAILSAALMLVHLGEVDAGGRVERAVAEVLPTLSALAGPGMGGSTADIGDAVAARLVSPPPA
ncbi:3-isopropylmalate dehydrogenase [Acidiferrimicrobium sp. IK]|uniref:3-isopropylmalate dehydrogenase n=1 Tax=Acidiferrimicrobium sp. IK TaxID=2871700 RepID=UPI0021CB05A7|nr:3-isopropylmalate dehydrogenase [Acidiferrimicrobium sp. IK]MCU4184959.1 3-isopropylmalate dehydrogenase [Acidiferrimicrobium sp. IK]